MKELIPLLAALTGACAVLLAQLITGRSNTQRLKLELAQRKWEATLKYFEPLRDKQLAAHEAFYDLLQDAIERGAISETDYLAIRSQFVYLDDDLRTKIVETLQSLAQSPPPLAPSSRDALLDIQARIRSYLRAPAQLKEKFDG